MRKLQWFWQKTNMPLHVDWDKESFPWRRKMKVTMTIDEAIAALQKAKEELKDTPDTPTLVLVLPDHGLATNVVDLVANKEDGSVRVIVKMYDDKTNSAADLMYKRGNRDGLQGLNPNSTSAEYFKGWQEGRQKRIEDEIRYGRTPDDS